MLDTILLVGMLIAPPQAPPQLLPGDRIGFDYADVDFSFYSVSRFEVALDGGAWADIGLPPTYAQAGGVTTRVWVPPAVTPGVHALTLRACNSGGCGGASVPFGFEIGVPSTSPGNTRIIR